MNQIIRIEKRKRGLFGWIFKIAFIAWNILMALWLGTAWYSQSQISTNSDAERVGHAIGVGLSTGILLFLWMVVSVILGLIVLLTRGKKIIIEERK